MGLDEERRLLGQQGQVPQLLVVALLLADADGVAVGLGAGEEVDGLEGEKDKEI